MDVDHDIVGTLDDINGPDFTIPVNGKDMVLHRVETFGNTTCPRPFNTHTAHVDGGPVYGPDASHEDRVLREPESCKLRDTNSFLPVTTHADAQGRFFFLAGDLRVDEHAVLTSMHTLWMREHNRICDEIEKNPDLSWRGNMAKYRIAKSTVISKMQEITVNEFLPALGVSKAALQGATAKVSSFGISVEFSIAYRLGHTLIPDKMGSFKVEDLFDGQKFFLREGNGGVSLREDANATLDKVLKTIATTKAAEMDVKVGNALRNILMGVEKKEDLVSRNIFRGRDLRLPTYAQLAECFNVMPNMQVNSETPDAWVGLLREPHVPGEPLGPTLKAMAIDQFHRIFFGAQGYWWEKKLLRYVGPFAEEIRGTTMAKVISANTGASVSGNVFKS